MVMVSSRLRRSFLTSAEPERVMDLLREIDEHGSHMPSVQRIEPGPKTDAYHWILEPMGAGPLSLQCTYCSLYVVDDEKQTVTWEPVDGTYVSFSRGNWQVERRGDKTHVALDSEFGLEAPVPRLMKGAAAKVLDLEYNRILDGYTSNLATTLDGKDGRIRRIQVRA